MGLFERLRMKKDRNSQVEMHYDHDLLEIVRIVSFHDEEILETARKCIDHTMEYYKEHIAEYEDRGLSEEDESSLLQWIGCVDILLRGEFACECDWKGDRDEFISEIATLRGLDYLPVRINNNWFRDLYDIPRWCEKLDEKWEKANCTMAAFDIDSDSYVMFICKKTDMEKLSKLAEHLGYRIDYAKNM